jgi:Tol biopolymer transport system component
MAIPGSRGLPGLLGTLLCGPPLLAQATERVSVASAGGQANSICIEPSISADGRFVAFTSYGDNLVAADTNVAADIFVRDRVLGTTRRISLSSTGVQGNYDSWEASISADGRYVAFKSAANNFHPGDYGYTFDVFVRDRLEGSTRLVSADSNGVQANNPSYGPSISADGRFIAFWSEAYNLVPGDTNGDPDVFVHDRETGTTERVSVGTGGIQGNQGSAEPSISGDGRYVVFGSVSTNLVPGDTNGEYDAFVHDRLNGTTERVNISSSGAEANDGVLEFEISADGRFVVFATRAFNLVPGDMNDDGDVFVHDRLTGTTERVSVNSGEAEAVYGAAGVSISADGRFAAFQSVSYNLATGDTNGLSDLFVRDRLLGTTELVSLDSGGAQATGNSDVPVLSDGGRYVAFESLATNLVPGDTNGFVDILVRDLESTGFASLCDPGQGGNTACPCSNAPSGPTRGCDNSSSTGGAALSASGVTHLSADTLVFATTGEKPTALSIVLQGNVFVAGGLVYGQGIRCVGGSLKRLYSKSAVGGSITAPDFGAGDLSVSAQSAAKGDPIQPGQPRWYTVYYRDPIVLGGCPSSSTFNATQTGQISWSP